MRAKKSPLIKVGYDYAKAVRLLTKKREFEARRGIAYTHRQIGQALGYSQGMIGRLSRSNPPSHPAGEALLGMCADVSRKTVKEVLQILANDEECVGGNVLGYLSIQKVRHK